MRVVLFMDKSLEYAHAIGRRKSAVALVNLKKGNGKIKVNGLAHSKYFFDRFLIQNIELPLLITDSLSSHDVDVIVSGGGFSGQSDAVRLGIARSLVKSNPDLKKVLRDHGFITRDPRVKERKKFGKYGARRSPQFTKR